MTLSLSRRDICIRSVLYLMTAVISGCLVGDDSSPVTPLEDRDRACWQTIDGERVDQDPLFNPSDEDKMMLPQKQIHSSYKKIEDDDYPGFDAYMYTTDNSHTILLKVDVYSSVDQTIKYYEESIDKLESPESSSLGDQAVKKRGDNFAEIIFRLSNAIGHVISYVPEDAPEDPQDRMYPPRTRVAAFAKKLRDYWGGTSDYRDRPGFCRDEILEETKAG